MTDESEGKKEGTRKKDESKVEKKDEAASLTEGVLNAFFPGIGKMIEELKKSEVFREKLEQTNSEIESRLIGQGTDPTERRKPQVDFHFSVRTLADGKEIYSRRGPRGFSQSRVRRAGLPPIRIVDILDEQGQVIVIIELHGIEEKNVEVEIQGEAKMILKVKSDGAIRYLTETELPSPVAGTVERKYSNGILEVRVQKKKVEGVGN